MHTTKPELPASAATVLPEHLGCNGKAANDTQPTPEELREACIATFSALLDRVMVLGRAAEPPSLHEFEPELRGHVRTLGALLIAVFLALVEERVAARLGSVLKLGRRRYGNRQPPKARNLMTFFGVVRYWRTYFRATPSYEHGTRGVYPTDMVLGLGPERLSMSLLSLGTNFCTRMSFEQAQDCTRRALGFTPSTEVLEHAVLGLGALALPYFEQLGAPEGDGDVLVIQLDSKGIPTATEDELRRRRGKRRKNARRGSPRHRGRQKRRSCRKRERHPEPGTEHAKNAKMATVMVAYTLRSAEPGVLEGPLNKRLWASLAPKRFLVEMAVREAKRRGFDPGSPHARIQVITDGDPDLERYILELFPHAIRSIDIMHVMEYVWDAGRALYDRHQTLRAWAAKQKARLLRGRVDLVVKELDQECARLARGGASKRKKHKQVEDSLRYIVDRADWLDYKYLREEDLEIGTGAVEGAVKHVVAFRFDHGGMRWIRERAEALLGLRCISINGHWDDFIDHVHRERHAALQRGEVIPLLRKTPQPLPNLLTEAA
jgi:hypothetical protein